MTKEMKATHLILPLLFLLVQFNPAFSQQSGLEALRMQIVSKIGKNEGDMAVAFKILETSYPALLINENEIFHAASTMKTPVMIEIFKQEAKGRLTLRDSVIIKNKFLSIVDGSAYSLDLNEDSQEELYEKVGKKTSIYDLMYQMIIKSSNLATNLLIEIADAKRVTLSMKELGANHIEVLRGVEDQKAFEAGLNNTTTALDMMLIMEAIAIGTAGTAEHCEKMMNILFDQKFKDLIPKLLPEDVRVAHKTGSITGVQHDAAIVLLPEGKRYVLVILSKNLNDVEAGKITIAEISRMIYEYVSQQ